MLVALVVLQVRVTTESRAASREEAVKLSTEGGVGTTVDGFSMRQPAISASVAHEANSEDRERVFMGFREGRMG
jgi:hypothetical protein